jgi:predicted ATPase
VEERPVGTVTFLLTDIEGSTRQWQSDRLGMEEALAAHDALLRDSVARHRGQVVKHTGDGILAVFVSAGDAVAAAVEAKGDLQLPVRMGIHTGEAQLRDRDYFGPALNRVARLTSAGHGGQILVSASTATLLDGVELADLGTHTLRDLMRPEHIWQVGHASHPPLRVVDPVKGNLQAEPPELFGRSDAIADVGRRLRAKRLVSLVGVAGVGKTSLALAIAHAVRNRYPDGVWFVELAPVADPDSVTSVIADAFSHPEQSGLTVVESLRRLLADKELLLVLDNCEHVLDAVANFVEPLLEASHSVDVLLTSREGLGVAHEQQLAVAPLPADGAGAPAVQLFVARAVQILDSFVLGEANVDEVIAICRELDGIPLAIELAATRVRSMTPREIRARLTDRLRLLHGGRQRTERHQTLRATVRWSYDLLTAGEQALLCRISVFVGGFTLAAAEEVCASPPVERVQVLDALDSLVAKSLVVAETRAGTTRYRLLETIRQFAQEELDAAGEAGAFHRRFAMHFLNTLMGHVVDLGENEFPVGFLWMDAEFDNLRAAFEWMLTNDVEAATKFCIPMGGFGWRMLRYEAGGWPARVLATRDDPPDEVPADLLGAAVHGPLFRGDIEESRILAERALVAGRRRPPSGDVIEPWGGAMVQAINTGDGKRILELVEETRRQPSRARILDDSMWHYVAWAHLLLDDMEASRAAAEEADRQLQGRAYAFFADWDMARVLPDPDAALVRYERAVERAERLGFWFISPAVRREIGRLRCLNGEPRAAIEVLQPVLERWFSAGDVADWTGAVTILAVALSAVGDDDTAAVILGAVNDRRALASALSVLPAGELDRLSDSCRERLGTEHFDRLYHHGHAASDKEIMDLIRAAISGALTGGSSRPPTDSA